MLIALPEAHQRAYRHPKDKTASRLSHWREYAHALRERGDVTVWIRHEALDAWTPPQAGTRGGPPGSADPALETALALWWLFRLPLRHTEGWRSSLLTLMDVVLPWPAHTTLARRKASVAITQQGHRASRGPGDLRIDRTGVKVCGPGAWHRQHHGKKPRKRWKTRPLGVDHQGWIVASCVTESQDQAPLQVPALFAHVDFPMARCIGDGIFDHAPVSAAVAEHSPGARVLIPPRKDAVLSPRQRPRRPNATGSCGRWRAPGDVPGNARPVLMRSVTRSMPFPDANGYAARGCGRSGRGRRSGSWGVRSRLRLAESAVEGTISAFGRFVQQPPHGGFA